MNWCLKVHGKKVWAELSELAKEKAFIEQELLFWTGDSQSSKMTE